MVSNATVVTPERFAKGYSYGQYIDGIKVNKAKFQEYYGDFSLSPSDTGFFKEVSNLAEGPTKALALAEDWCGDVVRGLPVIARVAEAAGLELRVFPRDENPDIMMEFLKEGKYQSIPVVVFYSGNLDYICHWIERPALADQGIAELEAEIRRENPDIEDREFGVERRKRMAGGAREWQDATATELRETLVSALNISSQVKKEG